MVYNFATDNNPDGAAIGFTTGKLAFYAALAGTSTPVVQPSGAAQAALSRANATGVIATFATTQSPSAVAANTAAEQNFTVQTGGGGQMLLATTDLTFINKPTAQAGLGIGNIRVGSSNTLAVNFHNVTVGSITPTASQVYGIVGIRGLATLSATLTPAVVAINTTTEQLFTVTGAIVGQMIQVSKPTAQAGLDIVGVRVSANNQVGITFLNATAATITPTAAEVYTFWLSSGLDAQDNTIMYGFNVGTVGAIGAGVVVSGGSTTLTGLLATDAVIGIFDPTAQAAATNAAFPVKGIPTANTLTLYFAGIGTGATPTAAEVYGVQTFRPNPAAPLLVYSQSLAPVSVAANTSAEQTFTVTGLIAASPVWVNKPSAQTGLGIGGVRVSAANTLAITYVNATATAIVPTTETYIIGNFQVPTPGAANVVYQNVSQAGVNSGNLLGSTRTALTSLGLMAGA